ncbi:MAG TPA: ABC transporter permease [Spirochaetales bacterium]|nr:ABC transporter permease [Spirochaetales bacterium]HRY56418.1 ABC transporter permease [Spirochaetia bacterium]HRZ64244.1 ABC transporter permease [Spirochaetia bacterium]
MEKRINWKDYGSLFGLVGIGLAMGLLSDRFLSLGNLVNIARQVSINAIIAMGMTLVVITGGIDLSVGSLVALSGCAGILSMAATGSDGLGLAAGLAVGSGAGLVTGLFVAYCGIPPFIATLAMLTVARGGALVMTAGQPIVRFDSPYRWIGEGNLLGVPAPILIMALVLGLTYFLLRRTPLGSYIYATGGNEEAARLSGIKVARVKSFVYLLSGLYCGIGGMVLAARLGSAQPNTGEGFELDAIAAVVLGGTSLMGGKGKLWGTMVGVFIIGVLNNGFNLLNVSPFFQLIAKGCVIILAVLLDQALKR